MPRHPLSLALWERYHTALEDLATRTSLLVGRRFALADGDLAEAYREAIGEGVALIALSQAQAATLTRGFFRAFARLETGREPDIEPVEGNAGFTADGRKLSDGLSASRAKVFLALKLGRAQAEAIGFGAFAARRFALTEVMDAASTEIEHQMRRGGAVGWRWASRGTCAGCIAQDNGALWDVDQSLTRHPNCRCEPLPSFGRERYPRQTGRERFDKLPIEEREILIGKEPAALLEKGEIGWDDLVVVERSRKWHDITRAATLAEAREA